MADEEQQQPEAPSEQWEAPEPETASPDAGLEERFVALKAAAEAIGCDVDVSLTIGGVKVESIYSIHRDTDDDGTLETQIALLERSVQDDRVIGVADAITRLRNIEGLEELVKGMVQIRSVEYNDAVNAFRQTVDKKPSATDETQRNLGAFAIMEGSNPQKAELQALLKRADAEPKAKKKA